MVKSISFDYSLHSNLIVPVFCQVLYPWGGFISTPVDNLQVSDLEARNCKKGNLKFHVDRHFLVVVSFWRLYGGKFKFGIQNVLFVSGKLFDCPFQSIVLRYINGAACWACKVRVLDIFRNRNKYVHVVCNASLFIIAFDFNQESYFGA